MQQSTYFSFREKILFICMIRMWKKLNLTLNVGFSHPIEFVLPEGVTANVEKNTLTIEGNDKQMIGEIAASIRRLRKPEPYKGKGIKYTNEVLRRKAGKAATTAAKGAA